MTAKTAGESDSPDRLYRVTSTSVNAVRISGTDDGDGKTPTGFAEASHDREVSENAETGTVVGAPVRVRDHSDATTYSLRDQYPRDHFTIDRHGQIRVGAVPVAGYSLDTIPAPSTATPIATTTDPDLDYERASTHVLTVRAAGPDGVSETSVNVRLRDLNEPPHFSRSTLDLAKTPIAFPERRRDLTVVRLSALEPDGDGLRWELVGPDASSFSLDDGKISFRTRPDFERPGSVSGANTHDVSVVVTELSAADGGPLRSAELPLTIEVTNGDDPGTVDFSLLQPEVGTPLTARLFDVDAPLSDLGWTWHVAKVGSPTLGEGTDPADLAAQWRQIPEAESETYTPAGVDAGTSPPSGTASDEGRYLLARVTYTDALGDDSVALAMTAHPVRPDVSDAANNAPAFRAGAVTITVPESLAIGEPVGPPVAVEMNIDDEVLTYELDDDFDRDNDVDATGDLGFFSIDSATGQLHLEKTLSHEATDGREYGDPDSPVTAGVYWLVVRATDPSGESRGRDSDTVQVQVVVTDVNDPPEIYSGESELTVHELDGSADDSDRHPVRGSRTGPRGGGDISDPGPRCRPNVYLVTDDDALETHTWTGTHSWT